MDRKGFTLLEMLVVLLIVSSLVLLTIPNINKVINSVDNQACQALVKVVDSAIIQFKLEYYDVDPSIENLIDAGYLSEEQAHCANGKNIVIEAGKAHAE